MAKVRTESFIQALRERGLKVRAGRGGQYYAQCPAHDDKNPSLSIKDDGGWAVIHCHAGCEYEDIIGALGLNGDTPRPETTPKRGRPPKAYAGHPLEWLAGYCDIERAWLEGCGALGSDNGHVVFRFVYGGREVARKLRRAGTKAIHWEPAGGLTPPLWPIPSGVGEHIVLCEGETDALILRSRGVAAYAVTKGAQAGIDEALARELYRLGVRTASIVFDADDAGRRGAERVKRALGAAGIAVDVVDLSEYLSIALGGKDVRDLWRADKEAFGRLLERLQNPKAERGGGGGRRLITARELMEMDFPLPTWRVAGLIPEAGMTILAAEAKLGKTWLALQMARAVTTGRDVLGRRVLGRGRVLYLAYEDGLARLRDRVAAQGWESDALDGVSFWHGAGMDLTNPNARAELADAVRRENIKLVIIDTLKAALRDGRIEENQAEFANTLYALREAVCGAGAALLVTHHHRKARAGDVSLDMRGTSALSGAADMMLGLYRQDGKVFLDVRGRDLPTGDQRLSVHFDKGEHVWELTEGVKALGETKQRILNIIGKTPLTAMEIQSALSISKSVLYEALNELETLGLIRAEHKRTGGRPARAYVATHQTMTTEPEPAPTMAIHPTPSVAAEPAPSLATESEPAHGDIYWYLYESTRRFRSMLKEHGSDSDWDPVLSPREWALKEWFLGEGDTIQLGKLANQLNAWYPTAEAHLLNALREGEPVDGTEFRQWAEALNYVLQLHADDLGDFAPRMETVWRKIETLATLIDVWNSSQNYPPLLNLMRDVFRYFLKQEGNIELTIQSASGFVRGAKGGFQSVSILVCRAAQYVREFHTSERPHHPLCIYPSPVQLGIDCSDLLDSPT